MQLTIDQKTFVVKHNMRQEVLLLYKKLFVRDFPVEVLQQNNVKKYETDETSLNLYNKLRSISFFHRIQIILTSQ